MRCRRVDPALGVENMKIGLVMSVLFVVVFSILWGLHFLVVVLFQTCDLIGSPKTNLPVECAHSFKFFRCL